MDLRRSGKFLSELRKAKGMTQREVAELIGVVPKTVSKWETGHGFPDVSLVSDLAKIYGVSAETILSGYCNISREEAGNMKKIKFYVCPHCGAIASGTGEFSLVCCGNTLDALKYNASNEKHQINVSELENDFYITFDHDMTKEHYITFVSYVSFDRVLTVRLYPEQDAELRFPIMYGGKFYYYCNKHGLFEYKPEKKKTQRNKNRIFQALE